MRSRTRGGASSGATTRTRRRAWRTARSVLDRLLAHPIRVIAVLATVQVGAAITFALSAPHNGWVWFQGGDQIWYSTSGWLLGDLSLPTAGVGYGWPLVLAPITWVTGSTYVEAMPLVVPLNVLVLGPAAVCCVYALATRIAGRLFGYWAMLLWVVAPYACIPLFTDRYHERYADQFLPQALGFSGLADYPSLVVLLAAAVFTARALERRGWHDPALAGILLGFAIGMKPPNALFAAGVVLAVVLARRWREALVLAVAVAPAVITLALWKHRGLGTLPLFAAHEVRVALGPDGLVGIDTGRYVKFDWHHWQDQMAQLREHFWSQRIAQWVPFAGAVAIASRRLPLAGLLGGWLAAFLVVKGANEQATIESGSFFRLLMPAWPAYLLLFAAIPLLVPTLGRRLGARVEPPPVRRLHPAPLVVAILALAALPFVAIAFAQPLDGPDRAVVQDDVGNVLLTPVDTGIATQVTARGEARELTWTVPDYGPRLFYRVIRTNEAGPDTACAPKGDTVECTLTGEVLATTREPRYVDGSPPEGVTYRIGVATNYADDPEGGDVFVLGPPVSSG
jgi:hypothetical protein